MDNKRRQRIDIYKHKRLNRLKNNDPKSNHFRSFRNSGEKCGDPVITLRRRGYLIVSEETMSKMPTQTTTYIERNGIELIYRRIKQIING